MSFHSWPDYFGELATTTDLDVATGQPLTTRLFGFENLSDPTRRTADLPPGGAFFGFVARGHLELTESPTPQEPPDHLSGRAHRGGRAHLSGGGPDDVSTPPTAIGALQYFATAGCATLRLAPATMVLAVQRLGHVGLRQRGGPLERTGRLRYIDGCSDTVLVSPTRRGDPCLNHLHFPAEVTQTEHHHPSLRAGIVARGAGWCDTPAGSAPLRPGEIFLIPAGSRHRFRTTDTTLDVVAFHPDSDTGPTDDDHPMINRTWLEPPRAG